jgi:large subunit ribosomal protein L29
MKISEIRELDVEALNKRAEDLRKELMLARFAKVNQQLKNPLKVRALRREIARVLTIIREKGAK